MPHVFVLACVPEPIIDVAARNGAWLLSSTAIALDKRQDNNQVCCLELAHTFSHCWQETDTSGLRPKPWLFGFIVFLWILFS